MKRRAAYDYNNCDIEIAAAEGAIDTFRCIRLLDFEFVQIIMSSAKKKKKKKQRQTPFSMYSN